MTGASSLEKLQNVNQGDISKVRFKQIQIFRKLDRMNAVTEYARNGRKILELRCIFFIQQTFIKHRLCVKCYVIC